jgi:hypothetical protein
VSTAARMRVMRANRKSAGACQRCGTLGYPDRICDACRARSATHKRRYRASLKSRRRCIECRMPVHPGKPFVRCYDHRRGRALKRKAART